MQYNHKKGFGAMATLVTSIVSVSIIILLIIFLGKLSNSTQETFDANRCKASVIAYSKINNLQVPFGEESKESAIECPIRYVEVESGSVRDNSREIANLMAECWDNYGRGKIRLFSATDDKFCAICSVFDFEDPDARVNNFANYIQRERAPFKVGARYPTYKEFLIGVHEPTDLNYPASTDNNYFDGSKRYAVIFTYYNQNYWDVITSALAEGHETGTRAARTSFGATILTTAPLLATPAAPLALLVVARNTRAAYAFGVLYGALSADGPAGEIEGGASWDPNIIVSEYNSESMQMLGCTHLPVSQIDARFRDE